ncbi:MAG: Secretion system C-terminal sorting domain, partial [Bacteroidota bacterium]
FTGTSGPAEGQTFTRTQNSDICVLSTVTPLLPYGSTYDVVISNTYTLTDGAGNTEQITVPSINGCQVITIAEPQTALSNSSSCNNGARFRGAVVSSMPWVCGSNNWRWRFTEVNPLTMQTVGLPIELNRGSASNYLSLGTVSQLQNGKTYAVQTAPIFNYTGTNYNWGPVQYMCIVGAANVTQDATQVAMQDPSEDAAQEAAQGSNRVLTQDVSQVKAMVYVTEGNQLNIQLTNTESNTAKRADIYDVTGKLVKSVRLVEGMNQIALNESTGIYMVRISTGDQHQTTRISISN